MGTVVFDPGPPAGWSDEWTAEIEAILEREDRDALLRMARARIGRVLRYLSGRLCSADEEGKWRAVRGLDLVVGDREIVGHDKATDLLRRFFWGLNEESGAVPYGMPEAIGEILAVRRELQPDFLPILCSLLTDPEMTQTGPIERGVLWALGRVGPSVASASPATVEVLRTVSQTHPDREAREAATRSLALLAGKEVESGRPGPAP